MKLVYIFKLIFSPILLPLSFLYGLLAFLFKTLISFSSLKLDSTVISIGNFCVGGSGKTPLCITIARHLKSKGYEPVIISKSYKGSLKEPSEVLKDSNTKVYGDEACLMKSELPNVKVFSGPVKYKTALYAQNKLSSLDKKVYILDDGAQHHKVKKDIKIHLWDMSRTWIDLFPFPLGLSRELWFLGESPTLTLFNRSHKRSSIETWIKKPSYKLDYSLLGIRNFKTQEELNKNFTLISGIGNFKQLQDSVEDFTKEKGYRLKALVKGKDHDHFDWFTPKKDEVYVCTLKDHEKLKDKVLEKNLFIAYSHYSEENLAYIHKFLDSKLTN